ncbi:ATP-dependent DNA helicase DinG [Marinospirillum alkaliphilum]|uniref:ATP-dependent DNA helicase DinG n=1 Tax=Marinospirillum alkaliphilum DSM 21637 TaxID=1122209 RepID=A0A1K1U3J8_9GAMM|nr:ATP-dependent DNA helicase DinG [Marinospirillum alkaliphilum]SFX07328.1 ATP-dependent DNA helicase DinG [Marinospirillum alkaliphilum DSM 21637]
MNPEWQALIQQAYRDFLAGRQVNARRGQAHMIADIAKSFAAITEDAEGRRNSQDHLMVIEAGTGTGKTLAYLLATLPVAQAREKRLVISTATIALQEQLLLRDLPDLARHTQLQFRHALAKGRGRYVCTSQLIKQLDAGKPEQQDATLDLFQAELLKASGSADQSRLQQLADDFSSGRWDGDRDSLKESLPSELWDRLTTDHQRCTNRRCPHFNGACPFFNARRELEQADVIVANHDLVLADLALGGGVILPPPEQTYYVFDEAHHLPDKAINHFAAGFRFNTSLSWLRLLRKSQPDLLTALASSPTACRLLDQLGTPLGMLEQDLGVLYGQLHEQAGFEPDRSSTEIYRWPQGQLPQGLRDFAAQLLVHFATLCRLLESLVNQLKDAQDPEKNTALDADLAAEWQPLLAVLHNRALAAHQLWSLCAEADREGQPPLARWLIRHRLQDGDEDLELCASPVTAAGDLAYRLWSRCFGATLTSATLTALGQFDRLRQRAGLSGQTPCKAYPSPFDYPNLGVLEIPRQACDPSQAEAHTDAIIDYMQEHLDHPAAAALVLFSSRRQMNEVYDALPSQLKRVTLTQDALSKNRLIEKHRERVDAEKPSIIFGLASLAEGIDLPGKYLTHVVIVRLPFSTPDDPVEATLAEWIEASGGNPFMQISVPDASIRLVQACGRLIRTEQDQGRVTLLDRRILTKRYGSQLLNSLPPFRREIR